MEKQLVIVIGIHGSGKSHWARCYANLMKVIKNENVTVVSSDKIRKELWGDESDMEHNQETFKTLFDRVCNSLSKGNKTVVDSTNLSKKKRIAFINNVKAKVGKDVVARAVWMATPVDVCIERNSKRERKVGENVIRMMYKSFTPPGKEEGFDFFTIMINDNNRDAHTIKHYLEVADKFDQCNHHHSLTLGGHSRKAAEYIEENGGSEFLQKVALLHDVGKLATATHKNSKGEETDELHFYQHNCTGAYEIPFYFRNRMDDEQIAYAANLVYYHMHPLNAWRESEKARKRDMERLDPNFVKDLILLHEADLYAH